MTFLVGSSRKLSEFIEGVTFNTSFRDVRDRLVVSQYRCSKEPAFLLQEAGSQCFVDLSGIKRASSRVYSYSDS